MITFTTTFKKSLSFFFPEFYFILFFKLFFLFRNNQCSLYTYILFVRVAKETKNHKADTHQHPTCTHVYYHQPCDLYNNYPTADINAALARERRKLVVHVRCHEVHPIESTAATSSGIDLPLTANAVRQVPKTEATSFWQRKQTDFLEIPTRRFILTSFKSIIRSIPKSMEVSGVVSRRLPGLFRREIALSVEAPGDDARRVPCSLSVSGVSVGSGTRDVGLVGRRNMNSRFCDAGHLQYYVGPRCHGKLKKEKEEVKRKLKLLRGLSGELSAASQSGSVFHFGDVLVGEFQGKHISVS